MSSSQLRKCPTCAQPWPHGERFDLRGFGWLGDLPRGISISNIDGIIHDGKAEDRFLVLESKEPDEWPVQGFIKAWDDSERRKP